MAQNSWKMKNSSSIVVLPFLDKTRLKVNLFAAFYGFWNLKIPFIEIKWFNSIWSASFIKDL